MSLPGPPTSPLAHLGFELVAYFVGVRWFLARSRRGPNAVAGHPEGLWVVVGAVLGAAVGSKVLHWLQFPGWVFTDFPDPVRLLGGKTLVGGLLGGLAGVEISKKLVDLRSSTGDLFAEPLLLGMMIGRLGCFFGGLGDATHGNPTTLPWAMDFGDGVLRHPAPLYEVLFLAGLWATLRALGPRLPVAGDQFRLLMVAYLAFRLVVEFSKPPHGGFAPGAGLPSAPLYGGTLTAIQLACLAGLVYYAWEFSRRFRGGNADG